MPDLCLKVKNECPPGGYEYTQPETGVKFKHYAYDAFKKSISEHRIGNDIPLDTGWEQDLEDQMCRERLPEWKNFCAPCGKVPYAPFSLEAARGFLKFAGTWIATGLKYVDQETATARAKTCAGCVKNVHVTAKCGACWNTVLETVSKLRGGRTTEYDEGNGSCALCSCQLKVAVWMPLEQQQASLSENTKNKFRQFRDSGYPCWKAEGL